MNSAQRHKNLNELFNVCKNVHGRIFIASAIGDIWDSYANFCPLNVWNEYFVDSWNNFSIGGGAMNKVAFCTPSNQCQEKFLHFREIDIFWEIEETSLFLYFFLHSNLRRAGTSS